MHAYRTRSPLSYTLNGLSAKIKIEGLSVRTKYRKESQEGRKEGKRRKERSRLKYTLIYFFSFYDMGVQKRRASDNDIINYQEKREVRVAGLRKGRRKEFGRTRARVRGRNRQVFLSFLSRDRIKNLFPFRKTAMRAKEKTANVWNH